MKYLGKYPNLYLSRGSSEDWPRGVRTLQRMVRSPRFSSVVRDIREAAAAVSFPHFGGQAPETPRLVESALKALPLIGRRAERKPFGGASDSCNSEIAANPAITDARSSFPFIT